MNSLTSYVLLDANILIYLLNKQFPQYQSAKRFLDINQDRIVLTQQTLAEYTRVTLQKNLSTTLTHKQHQENIDMWMQTAQKLITPKKETLDFFLNLVTKYEIVGRNVFDTYLVATALTNEITTIATFNGKDFEVFRNEGLSVIHLA